MIDIVVPFFNQSARLRACLRSLDLSISPGTQVILVDDASDPGEAAQVSAVAQGMKRPPQIVTHAVNRGFRDSVMSGIAVSTGEFVVLLNSDTIVTPGFDQMLVEVIQQTNDIAAVAPVSNTSADLFQHRPGFPAVSSAPPGPLREVLAFAKSRRTEHAGKVTEAPYLTGMCLALRRSAAEPAGWLNCDYTHGYFEDLDLVCRLRAAGHRLAIREDCFVYHVGHASYANMDRMKLVPALLNNYRVFSSRWQHLPEHEELMTRMHVAGQSDPLGTVSAEASHV